MTRQTFSISVVPGTPIRGEFALEENSPYRAPREQAAVLRYAMLENLPIIIVRIFLKGRWIVRGTDSDPLNPVSEPKISPLHQLLSARVPFPSCWCNRLISTVTAESPVMRIEISRSSGRCDTLSARLYLYVERLGVGVTGFAVLAARRTSSFVNTAKRNGCDSRK